MSLRRLFSRSGRTPEQAALLPSFERHNEMVFPREKVRALPAETVRPVNYTPSDSAKRGPTRRKEIWFGGQLHIYEGEVNREGQPDGIGSMSWPDGSRFLGRWIAGRPTGHGSSVSASGTKYDGWFENGLRHGPGNLTTSDGARFEGNFKKGHRHGFGKLFDPTNQLVYEGRWKRGRPHGRGSSHHSNGVFTGHWDRGMRNGKGQFIFTDGTKFEGIWVTGTRSGPGTVTSPDGFSLEAEWVDDMAAGTVVIREGTSGWNFEGPLSTLSGVLNLVNEGVIMDAYGNTISAADPRCAPLLAAIPLESLRQTPGDFGSRYWKEQRNRT